MANTKLGARAIYACDIGTTKQSTKRPRAFAWARILPEEGAPIVSDDINLLMDYLIADAHSGKCIALGLECPLFMPLPNSSAGLSSGRVGEGDRSMFAPAGAGVTTLGMHQTLWILNQLQHSVRKLLTYSLDWKAWSGTEAQPNVLFIWEAFVSKQAHGTHMQDAATAAVCFRNNEQQLEDMNAVSTEAPFNLAHACALRTGWATDLDRLQAPCLVLRPMKGYRGVLHDPIPKPANEAKG